MLVHCSTMSFETTIPLSCRSPLRTTISRVFKAILASPSAKLAIMYSTSSPMRIACPPNPRGFCSAFFSSWISSSTDSACKTKTLHRDNSAELISKEGFSVVAPMRIMLPFSTKGRNASCCALLKRWISSTNTIVFSPMSRLPSARDMTSLISLIPLVTALKSMKSALVFSAMILASVVFPTPGGPQKIMEQI